MTKRAHRQRVGFATLVTVAMLIFVSMAVMTLTRLTVLDTQRTQQAKAEAQQRQLLLAGAAAAMTKLADDPAFTGPATVPVPDALQTAAATLTLEITPADAQRTAVVQLTYGNTILEQTIELVEMNDRWTPGAIAVERLR